MANRDVGKQNLSLYSNVSIYRFKSNCILIVICCSVAHQEAIYDHPSMHIWRPQAYLPTQVECIIENLKRYRIAFQSKNVPKFKKPNNLIFYKLLRIAIYFFVEQRNQWSVQNSSSNNSSYGREPWSSGNGRRLMLQRSLVRIPAPYTGWIFFTFICCKNCCDFCLKKPKINNKRGQCLPILKKVYLQHQLQVALIISKQSLPSTSTYN